MLPVVAGYSYAYARRALDCLHCYCDSSVEELYLGRDAHAVVESISGVVKRADNLIAILLLLARFQCYVCRCDDTLGPLLKDMSIIMPEHLEYCGLRVPKLSLLLFGG